MFIAWDDGQCYAHSSCLHKPKDPAAASIDSALLLLVMTVLIRNVSATHPSRRPNKSVGGLHSNGHSHARTPSPSHSKSLSRAGSLDRYNSSTPFAALALPSPTHCSIAMRSPRAEGMLHNRWAFGSGPHDRQAPGGPGPHDRRASGSGPHDGAGVSFSLFHRRASGAAAGAAADSTRPFSSTPASVGGAGRAGGYTAGNAPSHGAVMLGSRAASITLSPSVVDDGGQQVGASACVNADSPAAAAAAASLGRSSSAKSSGGLTPNEISSSSRWLPQGLLDQAAAAGAAAARAAVAHSRRGSRDFPADGGNSSCTPLERLSKGGGLHVSPASPGGLVSCCVCVALRCVVLCRVVFVVCRVCVVLCCVVLCYVVCLCC